MDSDYIAGWNDYERHIALAAGLALVVGVWRRKEYKRGWRDAFIVDFGRIKDAPEWLRKASGGNW